MPSCSLLSTQSNRRACDQFRDQCQSDAAAFVSPPARSFNTAKAFKEMGYLVFRNSCARIRHRQNELAVRCSAATRISPSNVDLSAFERRLKTIFSHISRST